MQVPACERVVVKSLSLRQHWSTARDQGQKALTVGPHRFEVEGEQDSAAHSVTLGGPLDGSFGVHGLSFDPITHVFDVAEQQAPEGHLPPALSLKPDGCPHVWPSERIMQCSAVFENGTIFHLNVKKHEELHVVHFLAPPMLRAAQANYMHWKQASGQ